jgi:hypothetical protein
MAVPLQQLLFLPEIVQIHCLSVILQELLQCHQMLAKKTKISYLYKYFVYST